MENFIFCAVLAALTNPLEKDSHPIQLDTCNPNHGMLVHQGSSLSYLLVYKSLQYNLLSLYASLDLKCKKVARKDQLVFPSVQIYAQRFLYELDPLIVSECNHILRR